MLRLILIAAFGLAAGTLIWANVPTEPLPHSAKANRIVVSKSGRLLSLYKDDKLLKTYRISLGRNPSGHKQQEGDKRTPEGIYHIDTRNEKSNFHRALHVSYPDPRDLAAAKSRGVSPGGDIMVHGIRNGLGWIGKLQRVMDWTAGCIAVTNPEIEEIWAAVPDGTPIEIKA